MLNSSIGQITLQDFNRIKEIEQKAKLPSDDGKVNPTKQFLNQVAVYLTKGKRKKVTYTQAYSAWLAMYWFRERQAEKQNIQAEIRHWYSVNATALSDAELIGLHANLPKIKAQYQILNHKYDATDFESVYDLFLMAYDNEEIATKARNESIKAHMNQHGSGNGNV